MFFPYADDTPAEGRFPWMNWLLIAANVLVFMLFEQDPRYEATVNEYGFVPASFSALTILTSMFLHGGFMHLLGNMWFLYLFGDNVENRCGPFKYLCAYLLCGVAGCFSHLFFFPDSTIPSIGASGAIFGVLGMYLFFFPANRVRIFYWIIILVGRIAVPALWVIGLWFAMELFYSRLQTVAGIESGIGHLAHSGGFVAGVLLAAFYLALGLVRNDYAHLWAHLTGTARPLSRVAATPESSAALPAYGPLATPPAPDPRDEIVALLHAGRADEARRAWRRFAFDNHADALPVREQLEVALALDKNEDRNSARDAYERLIAHYPNEQPFAAEANLALAGMLLQEMKESGDLGEAPLVVRLLKRVQESHPYEARRTLAGQWLAAIVGEGG
jgi:membrane associated rhomboid family serine protease